MDDAAGNDLPEVHPYSFIGGETLEVQVFVAKHTGVLCTPHFVPCLIHRFANRHRRKLEEDMQKRMLENIQRFEQAAEQFNNLNQGFEFPDKK